MLCSNVTSYSSVRHRFLSNNTGSTYSWSTAVPEYNSDVSLEAVELWAWYETAGRVELLKSTDQLWNTGHVLPAAPCAEADTSAVVRRVQLTGSICYWGVMNTVRATEKWITATLLTYDNSNDCAIRTVAMVIIMISLIIMMIRTQMMAVEMMIMKVMCVCHDDDSAQELGLEKSTWWQDSHLCSLCMHETQMICISALDGRTCRTGEK